MNECSICGDTIKDGRRELPQYKIEEYREMILDAIGLNESRKDISGFLETYIIELKADTKSEDLSEKDLNEGYGDIAFYF